MFCFRVKKENPLYDTNTDVTESNEFEEIDPGEQLQRPKNNLHQSDRHNDNLHQSDRHNGRHNCCHCVISLLAITLSVAAIVIALISSMGVVNMNGELTSTKTHISLLHLWIHILLALLFFTCDHTSLHLFTYFRI